MAIDTRDKRSSAIGVALPWRGMLPLADGTTLNQGDRQHAGLAYRGILVGNVAVGPPPGKTTFAIASKKTALQLKTKRTDFELVP